MPSWLHPPCPSPVFLSFTASLLSPICLLYKPRSPAFSSILSTCVQLTPRFCCHFPDLSTWFVREWGAYEKTWENLLYYSWDKKGAEPEGKDLDLLYRHEGWVLTKRTRLLIQAVEMLKLGVEPLLLRIERSQLRWFTSDKDATWLHSYQMWTSEQELVMGRNGWTQMPVKSVFSSMGNGNCCLHGPTLYKLWWMDGWMDGCFKSH